MTGAGLFAVFVTLVGVAIVVALIFAALEFRAIPDPYKRFAKLAVGGAAFLIVIIALGGLFFGGGGFKGANVTPGGIIEFAISVIILYAVLYFIDMAIDYFGIPFAEALKFFLTIIGLVIILGAAYVALIGGGLGIINIGNVGPQHRSSLPAYYLAMS